MMRVRLLLLAGALVLLGACAGERHLGPRVSEAFDAIFAQQARERQAAEVLEMSGEESEQAMTNVRQMAARGTTQGGPPAAILLQK